MSPARVTRRAAPTLLSSRHTASGLRHAAAPPLTVSPGACARHCGRFRAVIVCRLAPCGLEPEVDVERLFLEERRRPKVLPYAFGGRRVLTLMFAAVTRVSEHWRAIRITEFERRQMAAVRDDLDAEYQQHVGLADAPNTSAHPERISSGSQT